MSTSGNQTCTIESLEERYFLVKRSAVWYFIGGVVGAVIVAVGITWRTAAEAIKSEIQRTEVKKKIDDINSWATEAERIVKDLRARNSETNFVRFGEKLNLEHRSQTITFERDEDKRSVSFKKMGLSDQNNDNTWVILRKP